MMWWGRAMGRFRWWVLAATALFVVFVGVWGTGVFGQLTNGGFETPGSESAAAAERIPDEVGRQDADVIVIYRSADRTIDDRTVSGAVRAKLESLPTDLVPGVTSYWSTGSPAFVSGDGKATYAVLQLAGSDMAARIATYRLISDDLAVPGLTTDVGGVVVTNEAINDKVSSDIGRAEALSMPVLAVLLVLIFGSVVAASAPMLIGGLAILGAFTALRVIGLFTDVSVFAVNIVTILGLGLAIDYALFVVGRFREELAAGRPVSDAVSRTVASAGRTVVFSGLTVAVSLAGLLLFPQQFLRSMGYGGIAAVLVAMISSLTVLPALLAVLGSRIDALRLPLFRRRAAGAGSTSAHSLTGAWARLARSVMRRPLLYAGATVGVLAVLGLPFLHVSFGGIDERVLPEGSPARAAAQTLERDFTGSGDSIPLLLSGTTTAQAQSFVPTVADVPGVTSVVVSAQRDQSVLLTVRGSAAPQTHEARDLVRRLRELPPPGDAQVLVGGATSDLEDLLSSIGSRLPWMGLLVAGATLVLMFFAFGSVVLPVKAIAMNVFSLGASFGVVTWIFQDGHLAGLLRFTSTGTVEATQPILMVAILFGLSMDYEVFLLSRIREQWDVSGDNTAAVAAGLQRTGRVITSAALLLLVVIAAFSASGITFIKMIGVGMAVAIVVDATLVRLLLVPATMRLLGRTNWWAPGPLLRLWRRHGLRETLEPAAAVVVGAPEDGRRISPERELATAARD